MKYVSTILLFFFLSPLSAQHEYPESFLDLLEAAQIVISQPLENQYKNKPVKKNDLYNYQYAVKKKKGDLEIRYTIKYWAEHREELKAIPHISTITTITTLASNEDDSVISYHKISREELKDQYHADWGLIAYFRPKQDFSEKKHCKMLTLFSEGKATINVFYLFDEVTEDLENQKFSVMFSEQK